MQWFRILIYCSLNEQTFSNVKDPLICEAYECETPCFALKNVAARNMEPSKSIWNMSYYCSKVFHFVVNWDSDFFVCLFACFPTGQFAENETNEVNFREIPSHVLSKVCMYFTYKVRYTNSSTEIPEFPIAPEIALELLMAANFLDC